MKTTRKREVIVIKGPLFDQVLKNAYVSAHKIILAKIETQSSETASQK